MIDFLVNMFRESVRDDLGWALFALLANVMFFMRFLVQWIMSERKGESYVPLPFWIISIIGNIMMLAYAIHIKNFMVILAACLPIPIYIRNIMLMRKNVGI